MNYYQFHIGDYAVHTRHLSLLEDLAYRRLMDWYYTNEKPIPPDPEKAARLIGMQDHAKEVSNILSDFFLKSDAGYINKRCDKEISKYKEKADRAKNANSHRWKSETDLKSDADQIPTTNQEPLTKNQEPDLNSCAEPPAPAQFVSLILNDKSEYPIHEDQIAEWQGLYPAADVRQELRNMRGWCIANPTKRKTKTGILRFVTSWLADKQNKGGANGAHKQFSGGQTAFDRSKQKLAEWEQANGGIVVDGQALVAND
jgi:uncharacterized protein YdaU (DUF1376 family)